MIVSPKLFIVVSVFISQFLVVKSNGQSVGIGTSTPNGSAMLEISNTSKGLLIPRMNSGQRMLISSPAQGLLVYQTDPPVGFYYNSGTPGIPNWEIIATGSLPSPNYWNLTGNGTTDPNINFIGTTDNQSLNFKTNNVLRLKLTTSGQIETLNSGNSVFLGSGAGEHDNLNYNYNVFIGDSVGYFNTSGRVNTAMGYQALHNNINAGCNVAIGSYALYTQSFDNNGTAWESNNIAIGCNALLRNQPAINTIYGSDNIGIGRGALFFNTIGFENTAIGTSALQGNITGISNTALGFGALSNSSGTGSQNTSIGALTLNAATSGSGNTILGYAAGNLLTNGGYNTCIGNAVNLDVGNRMNTISIGGDQCLSLGGDNRVRIGNNSMTSIGGQVGWTTISDERLKVEIRDDIKGLDFINKLKPVSYKYSLNKSNILQGISDTTNWSSKHDIEKIRFNGFLAQEVDKVAKETEYDFSGVDKPDHTNGLWGLRYAEFVVPLVKGMQEQQILIQKLQDGNKQMNAEIIILKSEIDNLKILLSK